MGLDLVTCRLSVGHPPGSAAFPPSAPLTDSVSLSLSLNVDSKGPGSIFLPLLSVLSSICLFGMLPSNQCEAAPCFLYSELQETLLTCLRGSGAIMKRFYRLRVPSYPHIPIKSLPRGLNQLYACLCFSTTGWMKRTLRLQLQPNA